MAGRPKPLVPAAAHLFRAAEASEHPALASALGRRALQVAATSNQGLPRGSSRPCSHCGAVGSEASSEVRKLPRAAVRRQAKQQAAAQQRGRGGSGQGVCRWVAVTTCGVCSQVSKRLLQQAPAAKASQQAGAQQQKQASPQAKQQPRRQQPQQQQQQPGLQATKQQQQARELEGAQQAEAPLTPVGALASALEAAQPEPPAMAQEEQQASEAAGDVPAVPCGLEPQHMEAAAAAQEQHVMEGEQGEKPQQQQPQQQQEAPQPQPPQAQPCAAAEDPASDAAPVMPWAAVQREWGLDSRPQQQAHLAASGSEQDASESEYEEAEQQAAAADEAEQQAGEEAGEAQPRKRRRLSWSETLQDVRLIDRAPKPQLKKIYSWHRLARSWKAAKVTVRGGAAGLS